MNRYSNIALMLAFMLCYTEWGHGYSAFIFQMEYDMLVTKGNLTDNVLHPLILAGLIGQLSLLYTAFTNGRPTWLNMLGMLLMGLIVLFFLFIGVLSANGKIILSTLPYLGFVVLFFYARKRQKQTVN